VTAAPSRRALRVASWALVCLLLLVAGLLLRRHTWRITGPIRFVPDLTAAWHWGTQAQRVGTLDLYDRVIEQTPDGNYILDYVPLRLLVVTLWVRVASALDPGIEWWGPAWSVNRPLLWFHTFMELLAACAAFALVRTWLGRRPGAKKIAPRAMLAAAVVWLSPAMMINSHGRPGTDVWIVSFYLWAILAATRDRWMLSGLIVATGAMLKGQQLIVCPVFVLCALWMRKPAGALRWLTGLLLGTAIWVSPWMLTRWQDGVRELNGSAFLWVVAACAVPACIAGLPRKWVGGREGRLAWAGLAVVVLAMPAARSGDWGLLVCLGALGALYVARNIKRIMWPGTLCCEMARRAPIDG